MLLPPRLSLQVKRLTDKRLTAVAEVSGGNLVVAIDPVPAGIHRTAHHRIAPTGLAGPPAPCRSQEIGSSGCVPRWPVGGPPPRMDPESLRHAPRPWPLRLVHVVARKARMTAGPVFFRGRCFGNSNRSLAREVARIVGWTGTSLSVPIDWRWSFGGRVERCFRCQPCVRLRNPK